MRKIPFLGVAVALGYLVSCQPAPSPSDNPVSDAEGEEQKGEDDPRVPLELHDLLYAWVDQLTIRATPSLQGEAVTLVASDTPLDYTGEESNHVESIVLRGVLYEEPWLKVITPDKQEGWVFGGAVKQKEEHKGNALMDMENFDFPHFGSFKLAEWDKLSTQDGGGGDAEDKTLLYQKGDRFLEITLTDMSEYGYNQTFRLLDANKNILIERVLTVEADIDQHILTETVNDYSVSPPVRYTRSQPMTKHFMELNARPMMVNGSWSKQAL